MDPHQKRPEEPENRDLPVIRPVVSASYLDPSAAGPSSSRGNYFDVSPMNVGTPSARSDNGATEYFPPLRNLPSQDFSRPPSSQGGAYDEPPATPGARQPSIRIRRRSSASSQRLSENNFLQALLESNNRQAAASSGSDANRPRSISQPERVHITPEAMNLARHSRRAPRPAQASAMPRLTEEGARPTMEELGVDAEEPLSPVRSLPEDVGRQSAMDQEGPPRGPMLQRVRKMSKFLWPSRTASAQPEVGEETMTRPNSRRVPQDEYDELLVDYLDTIDPEVQTLSTLTNVQNSLFVPDLGPWINRRPTYNLSQHEIDPRLPKPVVGPQEQVGGVLGAPIREDREEEAEATEAEGSEEPTRLERSNTISSRLTDSHYAALPHGVSLDGWTADEKWELDDHVRHMMHSRRSKFKRSLKGFGQYVKRPLGFFVTLYATLITLFGLAWVLFLIGWIYVGEKQLYVIHIIDSVLVALFAVMGDGLAPFRAVDTYHMIFVVHYAQIVKKGGQRPSSKLWKRNVPDEVRQSVDLARAASQQQAEQQAASQENGESRDTDSSQDPHTRRNNIVDVEDARSGIEAYEDTPLTPAQQKKLYHHQTKLAKSHSFYKPNETSTHYAFPLSYLMAIVILLDCHSCLQISLGACTWGIDYHVRPFALTTVILCVSITCNITAGLIITIGDRKTRKKDVWKLMTRQEMTSDAIKHIEDKRTKDNTAGKQDKSGSSESDKEKDPAKRMMRKLAKSSTPDSEKDRESKKSSSKLVKREDDST